MPPNANQEGHRNQHHFPEKEEEEEVQREKHPYNSYFQHQQHHEKFFDAVLDALPRRQDGNGRQERRQDNEEQTDSINTQVVIDRRLIVSPPILFQAPLTAA